jgi:hypothetical protein
VQKKKKKMSDDELEHDARRQEHRFVYDERQMVRSLINDRPPGFWCDTSFAEDDLPDWRKQLPARLRQIPSYLPMKAQWASSTDHADQCLSRVLTDDANFWSSKGSESPDTDERLQFVPPGGDLASVSFLIISVFRCFYQDGFPIYPPTHVQVRLGDLGHMDSPGVWEGEKIPVRATEYFQVIKVPSSAPIAGCVELVLYGKRQRQWEDGKWYTCLRRFAVFGKLVSMDEAVFQAMSGGPLKR